jgi:hypothetical protein
MAKALAKPKRAWTSTYLRNDTLKLAKILADQIAGDMGIPKLSQADAIHIAVSDAVAKRGPITEEVHRLIGRK